MPGKYVGCPFGGWVSFQNGVKKAAHGTCSHRTVEQPDAVLLFFQNKTPEEACWGVHEKLQTIAYLLFNTKCATILSRSFDVRAMRTQRNLPLFCEIDCGLSILPSSPFAKPFDNLIECTDVRTRYPLHWTSALKRGPYVKAFSFSCTVRKKRVKTAQVRVWNDLRANPKLLPHPHRTYLCYKSWNLQPKDCIFLQAITLQALSALTISKKKLRMFLKQICLKFQDLFNAVIRLF